MSIKAEIIGGELAGLGFDSLCLTLSYFSFHVGVVLRLRLAALGLP